jgi:hypothetical protein
MSTIHSKSFEPNPLFHPVAHYSSPKEVLEDTTLSTAEKRVVLSSWASDVYAVESSPWLREVPGMDHTIKLSDILDALRTLDDDPPPGGISARVYPYKRTRALPQQFTALPAAKRMFFTRPRRMAAR